MRKVPFIPISIYFLGRTKFLPAIEELKKINKKGIMANLLELLTLYATIPHGNQNTIRNGKICFQMYSS